MAESSLVLVISLIILATYAYGALYMNSLVNPDTGEDIRKAIEKLMPPGMEQYGQYKFLTYQCLVIQIINSLLHVLAYFVPKLRGFRDMVFTSFAYPIGSIVVYTFWIVWLGFGRELIFPKELDAIYPMWLNHITHTIIVPINLLLLVLVNHRYQKNGGIKTVGYLTCYTIFLLYVKFNSGRFVYPYLDAMGNMERAVYFLGTGLLAYLLYMSGQVLAGLVHSSPSQRPAIKKQKQK